MSMRVVEIGNYEDFVNLEKTWNEILTRGDNSVFSTWEWLSNWWNHFGDNKKLLILLIEENGETIGIAPLMKSTYKRLGPWQTKIEFLGTPNSDYNDFILSRKKEQCLKSIIEFLRGLSEKWNCIELREIPGDAPSLLSLRKLTKTLNPFQPCPFVKLPNTYEALLDKLSARPRKNIRRGFRRLEQDFQVDFLDCSTGQSVVEGMNIFFDLHQKRWNTARLPGFFASQETRNFHLDIARSFSQKGWLRLFLLKLSGKTVSAYYGFKYRGKFYSKMSGFDPKYSHYSVGSLLTAYVMRNCIENGLTEFDFMRGADEYKYHWNALTRWNYKVVLIKNGFWAKSENWLYNTYENNVARANSNIS